MITNKHPEDYEKPTVIIDSPVKLCPVDGHYLVALPDSEGRAVCMCCRGSEFVEVMQSDAAAFRAERVEVPNDAEAV